MAALSNRQKPIGRAVSAWWPGGRVATKALVVFLASTSSTARTAPPTARNAASNVPGDIEVSAASRTLPSLAGGSRRGGPLGMAGGSQVLKASGVADQESGHRTNVGWVERQRNPSSFGKLMP